MNNLRLLTGLLSVTLLSGGGVLLCPVGNNFGKNFRDR